MPARFPLPTRNDEWPEYVTCFACDRTVHCTTTVDGLVCVGCEDEAKRICDSMDVDEMMREIDMTAEQLQARAERNESEPHA